MRRAAFGVVVGIGLAAGCSKSSGEPAAAGPPTPVLPVVAAAPEPRPAPQPAPAPVPFRFPDDAGGKAVAVTLAPSIPAASEARMSAKPRSRTSELDRGGVPLPRLHAVAPKAALPRAKLPRLTPPPERVPSDLGQAAALSPTAVRLPERGLARGESPPAPTAADVPALARQVPDRASLDDPTAEIAAGRIVFTAMPLPFTPGWFLRFAIPNPFELAEQMKGKLGTNGEFGAVPVNVPPARPK